MTELTLPRAGTSPGRAARAQAVPVPTTGDAIGQIGGVVANVGNAILADRLDRQMKQAQVDLTRDMNDLRLEVMAIGDPDAADDAWTHGVANLRAQYIGTDAEAAEAGRATPSHNVMLGKLDLRNRDAFGLAFDRAANQHAYALGARSLDLRNAQRLATYSQYTYEATRAAATAPPEVREGLIAGVDEHIDGLLAAGIYDAARAETEKQKQRADVAYASAINAINADPANFLDRLDAGEFAALDPDRQAVMRATARDALAREQARYAKRAEKEESDRRRAVAGELNRIASIGDTSRLGASDVLLLNDPDIAALAKDDPDVALALNKARARVEIDAEMPALNAASPRELRAQIAEERVRPVSHPFQEERLAVREDQLASRERALSADPVTTVAEALGFDLPPLPMDQGTDAFVAGLRARERLAGYMQEQGWIDGLVLFTPAERTQLKAQLAATVDPAERQVLITGIAQELGAHAEAVLGNATGGDKLVSQAASLVTQGASGDVIADMLTGQKRLADGTATRPSAAPFRETFQDVTGGLLQDQPEIEARVLKAAEALYAEANPVADSASIDKDAARAAIARALGGDGGDFGGLAEIDPPGIRNQYDLILPPGVSQRRLNDVIFGLTIRTPTRRDERTGELSGGEEPDVSVLTAAALNGAPPDFGDLTVDDAMGEYELRPWWPDGIPADRYILVRTVGDQEVAVYDQAGKPFYLSLRRLAGGQP